jgi:hypothetical protein
LINYINQTLIKSWAMCGETVRRRWIEGEVIPAGIAGRVGTGLHRGAEVNHKAKLLSGQDVPMDTIQDAARDAYVRAVRDEGVFIPLDEAPSARKQISEGLDTTIALAGLYRSDLAPQVRPILVETTLFMDHPELPVPFRITLDVLSRNGQGEWWLDLKNSARKWPQGQADTDVQATLYNEVIAHNRGRYPSKLSFEIFTRTKEPAHHRLETSREPADFQALVSRVKIMLRQIEAGIFPPAEPGHWKCSPKYCGYWWTCPHIPAHRKNPPKRSE